MLENRQIQGALLVAEVLLATLLIAVAAPPTYASDFRSGSIVSHWLVSRRNTDSISAKLEALS